MVLARLFKGRKILRRIRDGVLTTHEKELLFVEIRKPFRA
jgi:hypothetical protein